MTPGGKRMNVNDLRTLVKSYNSKEEEIFDGVAETFLQQVRNEFEKLIGEGKWASFIGCTTIGISVTTINSLFLAFKFEVLGSWNLHHGKSLSKDYDLPTYDQFIKENDLKEVREIAGFQDEDIKLLSPFVKALQRKGLECYADEANYQLIVAFDI